MIYRVRQSRPPEKNHVVVFTKTNARILTNPPEGLVYWSDRSDAVVNPDRSHLARTPLIYWKLEKKSRKIVSMSTSERSKRDSMIMKMGIDNVIPVDFEPFEPKSHDKIYTGLGFLALFGVLYLLIHWGINAG